MNPCQGGLGRGFQRVCGSGHVPAVRTHAGLRSLAYGGDFFAGDFELEALDAARRARVAFERTVSVAAIRRQAPAVAIVPAKLGDKAVLDAAAVEIATPDLHFIHPKGIVAFDLDLNVPQVKRLVSV